MICCHVKSREIRHAKARRRALADLESMLAGIDRDFSEDSNFGPEFKALARSVEILGHETVQKKIEAELHRAFELCDVCGKARGAFHQGGYKLCGVCFLCDDIRKVVGWERQEAMAAAK